MTKANTKRTDVVVKIKREDERQEGILRALKGNVLKEFEKVCPTDASFQRIKKDMHDIFDDAEEKLLNQG